MSRAFEAEIDPIYLHTAVEHEEMHQETLMYLSTNCPMILSENQRPPELIVRDLHRRHHGSKLKQALSSLELIQRQDPLGGTMNFRQRESR